MISTILEGQLLWGCNNMLVIFFRSIKLVRGEKFPALALWMELHEQDWLKPV